MKIKTKFIVTFILISLIPIAIIAVISMYNVQKALKDTIETNFGNLAKEKAATISYIINDRIDGAELIAEMPALKDLVRKANQVYTGRSEAEIQNSITKIDNEWLELKGNTEIAKEILNNDLSKVLREYQDRKSRKYGEIFLTDIRGSTIAMTKILTDYYQADEAWWGFGYNNGRGNSYVDDRGIDLSVGSITTGILVPIYDKGVVIGILKINYKIEEILDVLSSFRLGETGYASLVRSNNINNTYTSISPSGREIAETEKDLIISGNKSYAAGIHKGQKTIIGYSPIEIEIFRRVVNLDDKMGIKGERMESTKWHLFINVEQSEMYTPIHDLRNAIIIMVLIILSFVVVAALFVSKSISAPIHTLHKGTEIIGKGDMNHKIEVYTKDEIGNLAQSFNEMTTNLRAVKLSLEKQNWLASSKGKLDDKIRGAQSIANFCDKTLEFLATIIEAQVGVLYIVDDDDPSKFAFFAGFACKREEVESEVLKTGEYILGQAAKEREILFLKDIPEEYTVPSVASAVVRIRPRNLVAVPILFEDKVIGLIELATVHTFKDIHIEFLGQISRELGIAINSTIANNKLKVLLETSEIQSKELMSQQEELRVANAELEENTANLEIQKGEISKKNREIVEKAQDLAMSSRYKSEFLANMSHELRTPLNSILLLSNFLFENKDGNLKADEVEIAENILLSGKDLLNLIDDILDLAKIESGKTELSVENIALQDLAYYVERNFKSQAEEKGLELKTRVSGDVPDVARMDKRRVEQVVKNFVSNALKFTKKGNITFSIDRPQKHIRLYESGLDIRNSLAISVTDTGIGIPKEYRKKIFEAFQQADGTTSREYGGTGLGLSISVELARLMGGEIQVQSEEGKGCTFTLYLPERIVEKKRLKTEVESLSRQKDERTEHGLEKPKDVLKERLPVTRYLDDDRETIKPGDRSLLIIEDDLVFAKLLMKLGKEKGFKCMIAVDGEKGLELTLEYKPSAIILDIVLPGINGWMALDRLKENPHTRHIPVQIFSSEENKHVAIKSGEVGFYTKPVSKEQLDESFKHMEHIISTKLKKLLVVEDDEIARKAISKLLGNGDISISTASTGEEALTLIEIEHFDCMVLDLGLSGMSGFNLLEKIKDNKSLSMIPVIIYSGKELSKEEELNLKKYTESVIIKGAKSPERLVDEASLFLHRVEANLPEEKQKMIRFARSDDALFKDKKILMVDDDMRNVFALNKLLSNKGFKVLIGSNGKEGLEKLKQNPDIDIVLMDIMMPDMDGYEAMRQIRKDEKFKDLPIIALTAKAMKEDRALCIEAGASDYLTKPVEINKLTSLLRVWLYC